MIRVGDLVSLTGAQLITSQIPPPEWFVYPTSDVDVMTSDYATALEPGDQWHGGHRDREAKTSDYASALELHDVEHDSRCITRGSLFACIPGTCVDGHDYAQEAVDAGARALLVQRRLPVDKIPVPQLLVESVRRALGPVSAAVHGYPGKKIELIGVTGTNGKTTTVCLIAGLLSAAGSGVTEIGTITGILTTPEATELQRLIVAAVNKGDQAVVMEVSSHALSQHRIGACNFRVSVFTNLDHDHLDYHETLEDYFMAKAKLFDPEITEKAVINIDTEAGHRLAELVRKRLPVTKIDSSIVQPIHIGLRSSSFKWRGELVHLPLGGRFNVTNAVTAAEVAILLGLSPKFVAEALANAPQVPGRFECIESPDRAIKVIVDYAHTPDGIENVLRAARNITDGRLIVVFGAGGDRDHHKRPVMGQTAEQYADRVVLTSDNPRSEEPHRIIDEIAKGMGQPPDFMIADRRSAIRNALEDAVSGDVIVVAGKGHENVQIIGDEILEFDDRQVVREELARFYGSHRGLSE